jgi:hypothetical protein
MATYKFENHNVELIDPIIEKIRSSFEIGDEYVSVSAVLNSNGNKLFWVDLGQMPNTDTWGDEDLQNFAANALKEYEI